MSLPFEPMWTGSLSDAPPEGLTEEDAIRVVVALDDLGFTRFAVLSAVLQGAHPRLADRLDRQDMERTTEGVRHTLLRAPDCRTLADQSFAFQCDHLTLRSLLRDGTVMETRMRPSRLPLVEWRPDDWEEGLEDLSSEEVQTWEWLWEHTIRVVSGKSQEGVFPDQPLAGLRTRVVDGDAAEVWRVHRARLAGRDPVVLERDDVLPLLYRCQHARHVHVRVVKAAHGPCDALSWLPVVIPPVLALWLWGPTVPVVLLAVLWVFLGGCLGRWVLRVAQTYRVLTPLLRWWPGPRPVPAGQLRAVYPASMNARI